MRPRPSHAAVWRAAVGCLLAAVAAAAPALSPHSAAQAAEVKVVDSRFLVVLRSRDGVRQVPGTKVPLLPGRACYSWGLRLDPPTGLVKFKEIFRLPVPLADWGTTDRDFSTVTVIEAGRAAVTERFATPKDGWIDNIWCVGPKDPPGAHSFEVFLDGKPVKTFAFEVVPVK